MSQDLTQQWLGEIQVLQQQLAELQKAKEEAWESSQKWRKLYNTEAEQRRRDAQLSQVMIASLKAEIQQLRGIEDGTLSDAEAVTTIQQEIQEINSVEELQAKLITVIKERDRLQQALKTEQESHTQTRESLTTALGDAINSLTRKT
jgi:predicted transcriptional regulator